MHLLLDTCTLIWLCTEPNQLSKRAGETIDRYDASLFVSHVSALEMSLKIKSGKMVFPKPLRRWLAEQQNLWKFEWLSIVLDHILNLNELPDIHKDPFDRLLVSQALNKNIPILTPDTFIKQYPVETVW